MAIIAQPSPNKNDETIRPGDLIKGTGTGQCMLVHEADDSSIRALRISDGAYVTIDKKYARRLAPYEPLTLYNEEHA